MFQAICRRASSENTRRRARIGKLNALLKGKDDRSHRAGPLGDNNPVSRCAGRVYEISNFVSISEVSYNEKGLRPELSYGSHFFQDLVEAWTFYTAIYPGRNTTGVFREDLFDRLKTAFPNSRPGCRAAT
jgi:hypothetical protein